MKPVCDVLGVASSNVHVRAHRATDWSDQRRRWRPRDDQALQAELHAVITPHATYGYRRAAALINRQRCQQQRPGVNHKRVYRVMRAGCSRAIPGGRWIAARMTARSL